MRMLHCPLRLPFKASRRFCGGMRKSSMRSAHSSCSNLRRATRSIFTKRGTLEQCLSVAAAKRLDHALSITRGMINVQREYVSHRAPGSIRVPSRPRHRLQRGQQTGQGFVETAFAGETRGERGSRDIPFHAMPQTLEISSICETCRCGTCTFKQQATQLFTLLVLQDQFAHVFAASAVAARCETCSSTKVLRESGREIFIMLMA